MKQFCLLVGMLVLALGVQASWYWPFGSDDSPERTPPRLSELMEPASLLIDEASDLSADGKLSEAIEKYREALTTLDRIEMENPDRAKAPEFASLRNKRAYVNAAIDSLLLSQVQQNARAVAVSDTTELEKRFAEEKAGKKSGDKKDKAKDKSDEKTLKPDIKQVELEPVQNEKAEPKKNVESSKAAAQPPAASPSKPLTKRELAMTDIAKGDYAAADLTIREMLNEKPNNAVALNLRAVLEIAQGRLKDAEKTLDQAIMSNPRNYFAFYNMARLLLKIDASDRAAAARYYETGRSVGGPVDAELEELVK